MNENGNSDFSAEDLALLSSTEEGSEQDLNANTGANTESDANDRTDDRSAEKSGEDTDKTAPTTESQKGTLATGEETPPPKRPEGYWPQDWREKMAEHISAGDKKIYDKELRRLQRLSTPEAVYGFGREAESRLTSGGLIKVPGKDAKPEEVAEYHKSLGVPEKPEDYIETIKLENGVVIGDADKPLLEEMLAVAHQRGAPPSVVDGIVNWYYKTQEEQAAALDASDDTFRRESERELKDELGPAYKRTVASIEPLFSMAAGGADIKNEDSLYARLMAGRMADGSVIGNDPAMIRWLAALSHEVHPDLTATLTEDGDQSGKTIDAELEEIQTMRTENPKKYWSDPVQKRELELITARERLQAKT